MRILKFLVLFVVLIQFSCSKQEEHDDQLKNDNKNERHPVKQIRGWNILSDHRKNDLEVIREAKKYNINHLQLSHHLIHDLKDVRDKKRRKLTRELIDSAHKTGVENVFVWDHCLYNLSYYPEKFYKNTEDGKKLNFEDQEFWKWFKNDYREMFSMIPNIDGTILTFIETGAFIEHQYAPGKNKSEKLAMVIDTLASLMNKLNKKLYIRTFIHSKHDRKIILGCLKHVNAESIKVMVKETPHDFFLYHPNQQYIEDIPYPVFVEFDCAHEYNGQGIVANTFTDLITKRWKYYQQKDNVIGYVARTDRYNDTKIINSPNEVLLYCLKKIQEDTTLNEDTILENFIIKNYGKETLPQLKKAFQLAIKINKSTFYMLGVNNANHSRLDIDYQSIYDRFIAGRWYSPPVIKINHDLNKEFHYFKDVIDHIAPARYKKEGSRFQKENPDIFAKGWLEPKEKINKKYLNYILTEKQFGIDKAKKALKLINDVKNHFTDSAAYKRVYETFNRTLITARLYKGVVKAYFGYRLMAKDNNFDDPEIKKMVKEGTKNMIKQAKIIENYPYNVPAGEWNWKKDAKKARKYYSYITKTGWKPYSNKTVNVKAEIK